MDYICKDPLFQIRSHSQFPGEHVFGGGGHHSTHCTTLPAIGQVVSLPHLYPPPVELQMTRFLVSHKLEPKGKYQRNKAQPPFSRDPWWDGPEQPREVLPTPYPPPPVSFGSHSWRMRESLRGDQGTWMVSWE